MAGQSAFARRIAALLAKGKTKKVARLEADDAIRRSFWRSHEQRVIANMRGPATAASPKLRNDALATTRTGLTTAYDRLIAAGYDKERALAMTRRLSEIAQRDFKATFQEFKAQPAPKIRYPRLSEQPTATAAMPELIREQIPDNGIHEFLLKLYATAKPGDIVEYEGKLYLRTTATGKDRGVPNFLLLRSRAPVTFSPYFLVQDD